ncbi:MAG: hypothetical protein ACKOZW_10405 [Cyanobium sp.]
MPLVHLHSDVETEPDSSTTRQSAVFRFRPISSFLQASMRRFALITALLSPLLAAGPLALAGPAQAQSDDEAKIEARVGAWGRNCKNAIAEKYNAKSMADVEISLGASVRTGIDAGEITLADIKRSGLSYNFRVHHAPGTDPQGYCNTDGQGNVEEIKNMHD